MNKRIGIIAIVFAFVTAFFFFRKWMLLEDTVLNFIPTESVLVISSNQLQGNSWLGQTPLLRETKDVLSLLQKAIPDNKLITSFLEKKNITYSLILESKNNLTFVAYIPINSTDDTGFIQKLRVLSTQTQGTRSLSHTFQKQEITEIFDDKAQSIFTYLLEDNYLIISQSGILIEDVARQAKSSNVINFVNIPKETSKDTTLVFWNKPLLQSLSRGVFQQNTILTEVVPEVMSYSSHNSATGNITLKNGFFLEILENEIVSAINCAKMITNNTASFERFCIGNGAKFGEKLSGYLAKYDKKAIKLRDAQSKLSLSLDKFYPLLDQEIALSQFETTDETSQKIIVLKGLDAQSLPHYFQIESAKSRLESKTEGYKENFENYTFEKIDIPNYPTLLLGSNFTGFDECYFVAINQYVVLANSRKTMMNYLTEFAANNVWTNSVKQNKLLEKCGKSTYTLIFDSNKGWNNLLNASNDTWKSKLGFYESKTKELGSILLQTTPQQNHFSTTIQWFNTVPSDAKFVNHVVRMNGVYLEANAISTPYFFNDVSSKDSYLMFQDAQKNIIVSNFEGKTIWKSKLNSVITSNIEPVNFLNSGHLELLFCTKNQANVLVCNPKDFQLYPFKASENLSINHLNVAETIKGTSKKLFFSDLGGNIYTLKEENQLFEKVHSQKSSESYIKNLPYFTIQGKNYFAGLTENGKVDIFSIFGNSFKKFPIKLYQHFESQPQVQVMGGSFQLKLLTVQGQLFTVDGNGNTLSQQQLIRSSKAANFEIIPDQHRQDWLVLSKNDGFVEILDKNGNQLFSIENVYIYQNPQFQYINFSADIKLLALTIGNETRLFNLKGEPLGDKTIQSDFPVKIQFSESYNKWIIYTFKGKVMDVWSLKIK